MATCDRCHRVKTESKYSERAGEEGGCFSEFDEFGMVWCNLLHIKVLEERVRFMEGRVANLWSNQTGGMG